MAVVPIAHVVGRGECSSTVQYYLSGALGGPRIDTRLTNRYGPVSQSRGTGSLARRSMGAPCVQDLEDIILTAVRGQDEMEVAIRIMRENICREAQLKYHIVQCLEMGSRCSLRSSIGGRA